MDDTRLFQRSRQAPYVRWTAEHVAPLIGGREDFEDVLELIGEARVVMLGEASHGTAEYYATRARLTRRLIEEGGISFVAIEGDWPDAYRVDRWVRGGPGTATEALEGFKRFPTWMWRNTVVLEFIQWLRAHNEGLPERERVGFYGLDVYSLHASIEEVLRYLRATDPPAAELAARRYGCLEPFREDSQQYALSAHFLSTSCEAEVVANLLALADNRARLEAASSEEAFFQAELNALAAVDAERYYRLMVHGGAVTWNLRDRHMVEVLNRLLARGGPGSRAIVWEHNTHIGDFRATSEHETGHLNVGQLVREQHGRDAFAVGFGGYRGTVTAAEAWDMPADFKPVPPARLGSYEQIFHAVGLPSFYLPLARFGAGEMPDGWLYHTRDERAIGVVYHPEREHFGNYLPSRLASRYDAYFFFDETLAVEPLDLGPEPPGLEAFPSGE